MTKSNFTSLDVEGHDGSTAGLYLAGTLVTATAGEVNKTYDKSVSAITDDVTVTAINGVATLSKGAPIAVTLEDPTAGTDDYKIMTFVALTAQAHTVTSSTSFGDGGVDEAKATFSGVIGDSLSLLAYNGIWYVIGSHQVTIAAA